MKFNRIMSLMIAISVLLPSLHASAQSYGSVNMTWDDNSLQSFPEDNWGYDDNSLQSFPEDNWGYDDNSLQSFPEDNWGYDDNSLQNSKSQVDEFQNSWPFYNDSNKDIKNDSKECLENAINNYEECRDGIMWDALRGGIWGGITGAAICAYTGPFSLACAGKGVVAGATSGVAAKEAQCLGEYIEDRLECSE